MVEGAQVVIGCAGESKLSPERIAGFTDQMKKFGVPLVDKPADMIGKVDGMLIEAVDGTVHYERAKPFLEAGIPCFIDKPFTCSVADAKKILELAEKKKAAVFSSSSLRYAPEVVDYMADPKPGKLVGCDVYGPASLSPIPERNAGLYHYGIHPVEVLYTLMGPGCKRVTSTHEKGVDVVTGHWKDGRVATVRGIRDGTSGYGFTAFAEKGIKSVDGQDGRHLPRTAQEDRRVLQDRQVARRPGRDDRDHGVHRGREQERRQPRRRRGVGAMSSPPANRVASGPIASIHLTLNRFAPKSTRTPFPFTVAFAVS